jgi:hypothetical protein
MKSAIFALLLLAAPSLFAGIPATPVMTLYQFNGKLEIPYYDINSFMQSGATRPAGTLKQGTSLIPCLVIRNGKPLTDSSGTPYVGFDLLIDSGRATPAQVKKFDATVKQRQGMRVANHHCGSGVKHVINIRKLFEKNRPPFFDPAGKAGGGPTAGGSELDRIVRAFHNSSQCAAVNERVIGRRTALQRAWESFIGSNRGTWPEGKLKQAMHLDYTMRTAIFEGHLDRGCNAYGACERNIIALSIRNRGRESCSAYQGCRYNGDFQGVSSKVSQYNIWDEYLTQISGITSCFLRSDLATSGSHDGLYPKLQRMYAQNVGDVERILFGSDGDLKNIFPGNSMADLKALKHYYHAPAMGKCFPNHQRLEYISGAVARKGNDFALIADTRIHADKTASGGYYFRDADIEMLEDRDVVKLNDDYKGFIIDGRKVSLGASSCPAYGIPRGCNKIKRVGRYRRTPSWLSSGKPLELQCNIRESGNSCGGSAKTTSVKVGGVCDTQMRPVAWVK